MDMLYRPIRGLKELEPYVRLDTKVPAKLVGWALEQSNLALPNEVLFWLLPLNEGWRVHKPTQIATPGSVIPADKHDPIGAQAVIDLHSHGHARPFFSLMMIATKPASGYTRYWVEWRKQSGCRPGWESSGIPGQSTRHCILTCRRTCPVFIQLMKN